MLIAFAGQTSAHIPQPVHMFPSTMGYVNGIDNGFDEKSGNFSPADCDVHSSLVSWAAVFRNPSRMSRIENPISGGCDCGLASCRPEP